MPDRKYIVSRTLENKIAIAENNDQNTMLVTLDVLKEILALLKEYEQSEQSYLRTLVELSNERDKLLKELGREDEHKYKDGSFMAGGNGIVKL